MAYRSAPSKAARTTSFDVADGLVVEHVDRHGDHVVTTHDARIGKPLLQSDLRFGADTPDRASDRSARDTRQHVDGGISREHAPGTSSRWRAETGPVHVVAGYHAGTVWGSAPPCGLHECRIWWLTSVRGDELVSGWSRDAESNLGPVHYERAGGRLGPCTEPVSTGSSW